MQDFMTLTQLLEEVQRQESKKRDFVASTKDHAFIALDNGKLVLDLLTDGADKLERFNIDDNAHKQIAARLEIPFKYYSRLLKDHPDLIQNHMNELFNREPETRMFRALDGTIRAFLSDRYLRVDHDEVLSSALPSIVKGDIETRMMSCNVNRHRLDVKAIFTDDRLAHEVAKANDKPRIVRPGFHISNSETGGGSFKIQGFFYDDYCTNGCVFGVEDAFSFSRTHIGKKLKVGNVESERTRELERELIISQTVDALNSLSDPENVSKMANELIEKANTPQAQDPVKAIELAAKEYSLTDSEKNSALSTFLRDQDFTQWGLHAAVTSTANDSKAVETIERVNELENIGGKILSMSLKSWDRFKVAA